MVMSWKGRWEHEQRTINGAIAVLICLADHFIDFLVSQVLSKRLHDLAQFVGRDSAAAILVENIEGSTSFVSKVGRLDSGGHHLHELVKVNTAR